MPSPVSVPISSAWRHHQDRSYKRLQECRTAAAKESKYDYILARADLQETFSSSFGKPAHEWQLDVAEAVLLGMDATVIAGTGSGKTIPLMLILLANEKNRIIVISPLKVLQQDQVCIRVSTCLAG